jgi:hypothetical protein
VSRPVLPSDVVLHVVDLVTDRDTLFAWCLISHAYVSPARSHLFRSVTISDRTYGVLDKFTKYPQLGSYVKSLNIFGGTTKRGVAVEGIFTAIAKLFTNVEIIGFVFFRFWMGHHGIAAQAALVFGFPNLQTADFYCSPMQGLATIFGTHPRLRTINFTSFHFNDFRIDNFHHEKDVLPGDLKSIFGAHRGSSLRLDTLTWSADEETGGDSFYWLDELLSYYADVEIERIDFTAVDTNILSLRSLLARVGPHLQQLHLDFYTTAKSRAGEHFH